MKFITVIYTTKEPFWQKGEIYDIQGDTAPRGGRLRTCNRGNAL